MGHTPPESLAGQEAGEPRKVGLIAGGGQFPILFSRKARIKGISVFTVAHIREADPELEKYAEAIEWVHIGQLKKILKFFKSHGIGEAVMMGTIRKTRIFSDVRPDLKAISLVAATRHTHDDGLLSAFAGWLETEGIRVRPSTFLLPELIAQEGCWTRRKPGRLEMEDVALGWKIAKEVGRLDVGQCVVVARGSVTAVEAIEGTDETIRRGARLAREKAVVVKVCKPDQDTRFDVPAVGLQTVKTMTEAGARVLAIEAGKAVVFDREEMIALADREKISIIALKGPGT
jgi:DUF1009 family protein